MLPNLQEENLINSNAEIKLNYSLLVSQQDTVYSFFHCQSTRERWNKMSLEKLFNKCAETSGYIKFDDLPIGSHPVKKFSVLDKSNYGGKRLRAHLKDGYVIFPERMAAKFANAKEVQKLNMGDYNLVFNGKIKDQSNRLDFRLENKKIVSISDSDSNDSSDDSDVSIVQPKNKKTRKNAVPSKTNVDDSDDSDVVHQAPKKKKLSKNYRLLKNNADNSDDSDASVAQPKKKKAAPKRKETKPKQKKA